MEFEAKISGTKVSDFDIKPLWDNQIISLKELDETLSERAMVWVLDKFYVMRMSEYGIEKYGCHYCVALDYDTIYKLTVLEKYPQYEQEFIEHFGENWLNHYIRFNH